MNDDLNLIEMAMRVGFSCALTAVTAVGIFMIIRFVAWIDDPRSALLLGLVNQSLTASRRRR